MIFTTREDIDAPAEAVFAVLSDFDSATRQAMRHGAEVTRTDAMAAPAPGMAWRVAFQWRGRKRVMNLQLDQIEPGSTLVFSGQSDMLSGLLTLDVVALSRRKSRLSVNLIIKPRTLGARLMLQTVRLTKGNLTSRFKARVRSLATQIAARAGG